MAKSDGDIARPRRSKSVIIIWLAFGLVVAVSAPYYYLHRDNEDIVEGGGRFAAMGFGLLVVLIVGTFLEGRSARRRR
jgi:hypothetical protein